MSRRTSLLIIFLMIGELYRSLVAWKRDLSLPSTLINSREIALVRPGHPREIERQKERSNILLFWLGLGGNWVPGGAVDIGFLLLHLVGCVMRISSVDSIY